MIGGSQFDESDFLSFAEKLKELTNKTYLVDVLHNRWRGILTDGKKEMKELLDSYNKESKFDDLNNIVVIVANSDDYKEVADIGDELYDFVGMTERVLKKIGIDYVLTGVQMDNIRIRMESPDSSSISSSGSSSSVSSRGSKKKKKSKKKHKSKKHKRRSKKSKKQKRRSKKSKKR
jgi:hypothetical protein